MKYSIRNYEIRRYDNCTTCTCGWPVDMGDTAYEIVANGEILDAGFCSRSCATTAADGRFAEMKPCKSHGDDECPLCTGAGLF